MHLAARFNSPARFDHAFLNVAWLRFPLRRRMAERNRYVASATSVIAPPLVALVLVLLAAPAFGEIYQCTAKRAIPTYQNFPCEFDSLGASSLSSPPAKSADAPPVRQPAVTPVNPRHPHARATAPRIGMTSEEVRAIWGDPIDTSKEEYVKGTIETWQYADSRSIQFDRKGRVTSIKW